MNKIFADCSTDNVGISAVWSAFAGFIFLGWWRIKHLSGGASADGSAPKNAMLLRYATLASLVMWTGVCVYYAVVEEAITTVAHLVAFGVGAGALLLFERLHQIPQDSGRMSVNGPGGRGGVGGGASGAQPPPYEQLRDD